MSMLGTIVNTLGILLGGGLGLLVVKLFHRGIPQRYSDMIMNGMALCVFSIAFGGILQGQNTMITIFSMVLGSVIGEWMDLNSKVERLSQKLEQHFSKESSGAFARAFMTSTLLFCVGAMSIKGALDSGLLNDHSILYAKSIMDGITSCLFASTMGVGVLFSAASIFIYEGALTLLASVAAPFLSDVVIAEMNATGSLLLLAMSLNLLGVTKLKIMNYLPAIFLPILFCQFM